MNVLVTGGAGFIGSHTCVELQQQGHAVVIVDSLCNSDAGVIGRIGDITVSRRCSYRPTCAIVRGLLPCCANIRSMRYCILPR